MRNKLVGRRAWGSDQDIKKFFDAVDKAAYHSYKRDRAEQMKQAVTGDDTPTNFKNPNGEQQGVSGTTHL